MIDQREAISEKAVLIGVITQQQDESKSTEYLDELEFLTKTAGGSCCKDGLFRRWRNQILKLF